jgi:pheromone a factor receptor
MRVDIFVPVEKTSFLPLYLLSPSWFSPQPQPRLASCFALRVLALSNVLLAYCHPLCSHIFAQTPRSHSTSHCQIAAAFKMADVADVVDIMPDLVNHVSRVFMCIVCFLGIILPLPTFRAYYKRRAPTTFPGCNMIALNCLLCLQYLINAIIWPTQDINDWWDGTGLCDIQAPLKYPFTLSLALSLWRLMNALATAVRGQPQFELSNAERRKLLLKEALYCWLVPLVQIPLSYLVRKGRFAVVPVMGCADLLDDSWLKFLIITVWCPLVMLLTSYSAGKFSNPTHFLQNMCVYYMNCELTVLSQVCIVVRVLKHRRNISGILVSNGSGLRDRIFLRMAIISIVVLLSYIPVQGAFFFNAISSGVTSYSLFDNYSNGWNQPDRVTLADYGGQMSQYIGWTSAAWNLVFFLFSGFERESVIETRKMLVALGFGKFWPSLAQPLQPRCGTASSNRTLLQSNRLTSWMFDPVTLRFDPFGNLLTWLATSPRLDRWAVGNLGKFMQWVEGAIASTSKWFRRCLQWNWSSRRSISNNQATTVVGEDLEL